MIRRLEKEIILGDGADATPVTIREVTPGQAIAFNEAIFGAVKGEAERPSAITDLIIGNPELKLTLLEQCTSLGAEVHELGAFSFLRLWGEFEEVNAPFLAELLGRLRKGAVEFAATAAAASGSTAEQSREA